ncbi:MAG TPA: hypothetical protein PLD20_08415 [Blastocatellia bacterium]|nr:hypothetical protein [Blastocatellia bacterium]HMV84119.1 hypothetical protein [Blastocatellia bacterium]HMX29584.1 hypothetical protein [Blastocatellia bacterium]HMY71243.1 hypothetical protein [Blastocatellia bacterium]HMZ17938.1 hypothetical protein [Blastocatellia bacterium]
MAVISFETVLTQAEQLPPQQRAQLIGVLAQSLAQPAATQSEKISLEERRARIRAFRGKYRGSLSSVDDFLAANREEVELEEARYLAQATEMTEKAQ